MKAKSDKETILEYLQSYGELSALDAFKMWNILTSLRSRISDLRKDGYNIQTEMISENGKSFARYKLIKNAVQTQLF